MGVKTQLAEKLQIRLQVFYLKAAVNTREQRLDWERVKITFEMNSHEGDEAFPFEVIRKLKQC